MMTFITINDIPKDVLWLILRKVFQDVWDKEYSYDCYFDECGANGQCANPLNVKYKRRQKTSRIERCDVDHTVDTNNLNSVESDCLKSLGKSNHHGYYPHIGGWFSSSRNVGERSSLSMTDQATNLINVNKRFRNVVVSHIDFHIGCWAFLKGSFD